MSNFLNDQGLYLEPLLAQTAEQWPSYGAGGLALNGARVLVVSAFTACSPLSPICLALVPWLLGIFIFPVGLKHLC